MGLFGKAAKAGIAKKAFDEARKPHNQRKIKDFVSRVRGGSHGGGTSAQQPPRR